MTTARQGGKAATELDDKTLDGAAGGVKAFSGAAPGEVATVTPAKAKTGQTRQATLIQDV